MIISMTTNFPLILAFEVSACHTGAVAVFRPLPMPATMRATSICGTPYAEVCNIAPMVMIDVPRRMVFFRPYFSPNHMAARAPKNEPTSVEFWRQSSGLGRRLDLQNKMLTVDGRDCAQGGASLTETHSGEVIGRYVDTTFAKEVNEVSSDFCESYHAPNTPWS